MNETTVRAPRLSESDPLRNFLERHRRVLAWPRRPGDFSTIAGDTLGVVTWPVGATILKAVSAASRAKAAGYEVCRNAREGTIVTARCLILVPQFVCHSGASTWTTTIQHWATTTPKATLGIGYPFLAL